MKRPRNRIAIAVIVVALAVGLGAFMLFRSSSNASTPSGPPAAQQGGGPNGAAFQQFRQCMVNNGVTLSPGQRPNPSDPAVQKARQACAQYAPQRPGGGNGFGGPPPASGTNTTPGT